MAEYKLSYTAKEIDEKLGKIDSLAKKSELPSKTSDLINNSGFTTETYVQNYSQPKGDYALKSEIPDVPSTDGLASETYVNEQIANLVNSAPDKLNTLEELAAALGDDENFANTVTTELSKKANASIIQISDVEPTDEETEIWINMSEDGGSEGGVGSASLAAHNIDVNAHADIREQISQLSSEKVDETFLFDYAEFNNYADMSTLMVGMIHTDGKIYTGGDYNYYSYFPYYIPVNEGEVLSLQYTKNGSRYWSVDGVDDYAILARVAAYNEQKTVNSALGVVSSSSNFVRSYTVPSGVSFVRITLRAGLYDNCTEISLVKNAKSVHPYVEYGTFVVSTIKEQFIPEASKSGNCYFSIPESVNVKVGNEFKVYFRNIMYPSNGCLWVGSNSSLNTRYYEDYLSIVPVVEGDHTLDWKLYDDKDNILESGTLTIIASVKSASDVTTALILGDSFVNAGVIGQKAIDLYATDGATLNLLGTRGSAPNLHEGRGGWRAANYCTTAQNDTFGVNPFYNNGFDFSYYMRNQGYSGVQIVVINLGVNDVFAYKDTSYKGDSDLTYFGKIVDSILAYDGAIKVIINLPTTPSSDGTSFTETYGTSQIQWLYNRNVIRFAAELRDYFANKQNVVISASNCVLDTKTQVQNVHPTTAGYQALGQRLYEVMINVADGQIVVVPLIDVMQRDYIKHSGNTIAATATHDLSETRCYTASYQGVRSAGNANNITYIPISENSFSLTLAGNASSGIGVEFPLPQLEVGKSYTLTYTADVSNMRVYLIKYNADTTYNSNTTLSSGTGNKTATITPESGYIYSILFATLVANTTCTYSNINVVENE